MQLFRAFDVERSTPNTAKRTWSSASSLSAASSGSGSASSSSSSCASLDDLEVREINRNREREHFFVGRKAAAARRASIR